MPHIGPRLALAMVCALAADCRREHQSFTRGDAAAVVVARPQPGAPAGVPSFDEKEPNDRAAGPNYVPFGAAGLIMRGTLTATDEDTFAIEIPGPPAPPASDARAGAPDAGAPVATHRLAIEVVPSEGLATELTVRSGMGAVLATSRPHAPGQRYGLPNLGVAAGSQVVVGVSAAVGRPVAATALPYTLALHLLPLEGGEEREPNDVAAQATALPPAHAAPEAAGFIGAPKDEDWFRVPLGAVTDGTVLSVELEPPPGLGASLTLFDASAHKVASASVRKGQHALLRNLAPRALAGTPPAAGDAAAAEPAFYAVVRAEGDAFDLDHRYVLRVRADAATNVDEREPNDDPANPGVMVAGAATGYLPAGDVDVFRLELPSGSVFTAEVVPPRRLDVVLEILPAPGGRWLRADSGRRGQPERLEAVAGGAVLVRVSPKKGDGSPDEAYRLNVRMGSAAADGGAPPGPGR